jgi:hypothetical protein
MMVGIYDLAGWGVITGLALMVLGGLVLWAYGARNYEVMKAETYRATGPEAEATQRFHVRLVKTFFYYGLTLIVLGAGMLFQSSWLLI